MSMTGAWTSGLRSVHSYLMTNKVAGRELEAVGEYIEIDPPRRLVFTVAMPQFEPHVDRIAIEIVPTARVAS